MKDRVLSLLSLIRKANKLCLSKDILNSFKYGNIHFVFIASDASDKTKERYLKKCFFYKCPYTLDYDSLELSLAIGKRNIMTIGITDKGFSDSLLEKMINKGGENYGKECKE